MEPNITTTDYTKLTFERILQMIEEKGTAEGLDLSGQDLSWLDLSSKAVESALLEQGYSDSSPKPPWISPYTWGKTLVGLNLHLANLQGANLQRANLYGIDLSRANLQDADLRDTCLQFADLHSADLRRARLWRADLREAIASNANFTGASLYRANLENARMIGADLQNSSLESANLADARITRKSIGAKLIQENSKRYVKQLLWDDPNLRPDEWDRFYIHRLERTKEIYKELLSSFSRHGYRDDASWAYYRERMYERKMHAPTQARLYFGDEVSTKAENSFWQWQWFYLRHFVKWLGLWASELSCGYGERPLRAAFLALIIVPAFAYLYQLSNGVTTINGQAMTVLDYLNYSFGAFATVGFARFITVNALAEALTSVEALFGIATLALLMFALGNRLSR